MTELPFAYGGAPLRGKLRVEPEDFFVDEQLGFEASGSGEHWFIHIEKRGANTGFVAKQLAQFAGVTERDVGYAGMKDRHALARQSFTVLAKKGQDTDWSQCAIEGVTVLSALRHARKIQRGALRGNAFVIRLREVDGGRDAAAAVVRTIAAQGVPNYFGEQRFGRGGANVEKALAMFAGKRVERAERSILLSAARSELFNAVLATRVADGSWQVATDGDVFQLDGRSAIFGPEPIGDELRERAARGDIHPTGPMFGRGELRTTDAVHALELAVLATHPELCAGLIAAGLDQERRSLRLMARDIQCEWDGADLITHFTLPAGAHATTVLRELVDWH
ncbi:MAG: tRNA pseudouridine(13) synthase TruD [Rhodanobacteraceae bacterium]|nr:tRNA pseudouridine(13) synthase TruD [Rhodanobacteraceae bacterium]